MDGAKEVAVITAVVVPSYCFISVHLQAGVYWAVLVSWLECLQHVALSIFHLLYFTELEESPVMDTAFTLITKICFTAVTKFSLSAV